MGNNVVVFGYSLGFSTDGVDTFGITAGGQYFGGVAVLPDGEIDGIASLSGPVGFGVATPYEVGVQTIVLRPGLGLDAFLGPGGTATVQSGAQAGIVYSGYPWNPQLIGVVGGLTSSISATVSWGWTWKTGTIAPPLSPGAKAFNDYGLSAAGIQTAGSTPAKLGEGTSVGTMLDIAREYMASAINDGVAPFNDYGLSSAGLQTAGSNPTQMGDGTAPGTLLDIARQYLDTHSVFDTGAAPFNDYGLGSNGFGAGADGASNGGDGVAGGGGTFGGAGATGTWGVTTGDGNGIGNWWTNTATPAFGLDSYSVSGPNDGSVFSTGTAPFNSYGSNNDYNAYFGNDYGDVPSNGNGYGDAGSGSGGGYDWAGSDGGGGDWGGGDWGGDGGGDFGFAPVVLDLAGKGINIAKLSSSNTYRDMTGDGYKNLTAWAGVGNGVLFVDTSGQGQLTQANQIIFTKWDPGAKSDMQALLDVFDTNHDGALDAGDADFSQFFVMVTNANGTQTAYSL
ncbi:MAG: hypothetical protein WA418_32705, partial [Bradyrhizobium sp.]